MQEDANSTETRNHYVYLWKYPEHIKEGAVFYVGQGTHGKSGVKVKYARAYAIHFQDKKRRRSYAQNVFDKIVSSGDEPIIEIYSDNLTQYEANNIEKSLINQYGRRNNNTGILCNLTDGGDFNPMHDPDIMSRFLQVMKSPEHRLKRSIGAKEFNARPHILANNIKNGIEMWKDPEFKAKMISKYNSPETLEKQRSVQAEISGVKIVFNGKEYRSKKELARFLGISFQALHYRIKHNIQLDLPITRKHFGN